MRTLRRIVVVALTAIVVLTTSTMAFADNPPPARVLSRYETTTGNTVGRDCGFSVVLRADPTRSLWLFCDTGIYNPAGDLIGFIGGSTAAVGPFGAGQVPTGLSEIATPPTPPGPDGNRAPAPFLPAPAGLVLPDGTTPCGAVGSNSYAASWLSGAARGPNRWVTSQYHGRDLIFITYINVCVTGVFAWSVQGFGFAFYHPASNTVVSNAAVFRQPPNTGDLAWQRQLASPIFSGDGYLYLYASHCDEAGFGHCFNGRTILARTPWRNASAWDEPDRYRYWTPTGWTADPTSAQSVMTGARPFSADIRSYPGQGLVLIEQTSIAGHYRLWRSPSFTGPWTAGSERVLPTCDSNAEGWCYAFIGHPELSTPSSLLMSYYDPDDRHLRDAAVPW